MTAKAAAAKKFYGTGRRKTAIARVRLSPGTGLMEINEKPADAYFARESLHLMIQQPFETVGMKDKINVIADIIGGGVSSQAGALRHGIARALLVMDPELRKPLKLAGFLTRDAREKERRKVGRRKARRRPQYSKR